MPILTTLTKAVAIITATADANIVADETLDIGGKTYTFDADLSPNTDGYVKYVTAYQSNLAALAKAINLSGIVDTHYTAATTRNPYVDAVYPGAGGETKLDLFARTGGAVGNLIALTESTTGATVSGALFTGGAGSVDTAINELQSDAQLNSDVLAFLAAMEVKPIA